MKKSSTPIEKTLSLEIDPAFRRRAKIILTNLNIKSSGRVLDAGCGRGFYLKTLSNLFPKTNLYGIDLNQKYLQIAKKFINKKSVKLSLNDITKLPFRDNYFDKIIASEIIEHISNDQKALGEIYRVLKPGGIALISVPNRNYPFCWDPINWVLEKLFNKHIPANRWWLAGIWADHKMLYYKKELANKIVKTGFKIEKCWQNTHYCIPFSHFLLYGIGKNLVEKGLFTSANRFNSRNKPGFFIKIILMVLNTIDNLNKNNTHLSSVNLIVKCRK